MLRNSILKVGIAPFEEIKKRTLAIARGEYKPGKNEPKVWFSSMESLAQVLSSKNKLLLEIIVQAKPESVTELAKISGRHKSNLSRTLKTLANYGMVKLAHLKNGKIKPRVQFKTVHVDFDLQKTAHVDFDFQKKAS
ncbi:MAG TPA: helix-turn-helix domain-containing protein [Gammaproteobacteria bacterium]|nr:helix-turn-helix domain-containing protein [Gammaproteobacteria bacterium]